MHCLVNNYLPLRKWDAGTKIGAVNISKIAIICRPDKKKAKIMKICPNSNKAAQKDNPEEHR